MVNEDDYKSPRNRWFQNRIHSLLKQTKRWYHLPPWALHDAHRYFTGQP